MQSPDDPGQPFGASQNPLPYPGGGGYPPAGSNPPGSGGYPPVHPGSPLPPSGQVNVEAIGKAWTILTRDMGTWILITIIIAVLVWFVSNFFTRAALGDVPRYQPLPGQPIDWEAFMRSMEVKNPLLLNIGSLVTGLLSIFLYGGAMRVAVKQARGQEASVGDLFSGADVFGTLVGICILTGLAAIAGGFVFLVFAIYAGVVQHSGKAVLLGLVLFKLVAWALTSLLLFSFPLAVDKRASVFDAMGQSFAALKVQLPMAMLYTLLMWLASLSGLLLCCIGIILTMPLLPLSIATLYVDFFGGGTLSAGEATSAAPSPIPSPD